MRFDIHVRATVAASLGVLALTALASHILLRLLLGFLAGPIETGFEKEIISTGALMTIAGLIGLMMAVVCFRPILGWIRQNGLPGLIEAPSPFEGKHIRVALVVSDTGGLFSEVYSQWVPAHYLNTLMKGPLGKHLTLGNKLHERLSIVRNVASENEGGGDVFVVKLKKRGKVVYSLEMLPGKIGTYESDQERDYASCWFPLVFVGTDGANNTGGWLKFGGDKRIMRLVYLD